MATGALAYDIDMGADIAGLSLTHDGRHIALPTEDVLHVITSDLEELIDLAEERAGRGLTDDECRIYLHVETCPTR